MRLDEWIVQKNYLSSRSKANRFIREQGILINGKKVHKPSYRIISDDTIELDQIFIQKYNKPLGYHKFELIVSNSRFPFSINSNDVCLDIGASAGGFSLF
ncbi:MAG: S4 domain-containing protein, partial [Promethearchaeota archaeon]